MKKSLNWLPGIFLIIFLLGFLLLEVACNKPACGSRHQHKVRTAKMKREGMYM